MDVYLVIYLTGSASVVPLATLRKVLHVERVDRARDGAIFRVDGPGGAGCRRDASTRPTRAP
jgi:hypothetical protein